MRQDKANGNEGVGGAGETIAQQISPDGVSIPTRNREKALLLSMIPGLIVAGVVALAVWGVLEVMPSVFELPEHLRELSGNAPEEQQKERLDTSLVVSNRNAALSLVMLVSTLSLFLTIAEVKLRHQGLRAIWGGLLAMLIASVFAVDRSGESWCRNIHQITIPANRVMKNVASNMRCCVTRTEAKDSAVGNIAPTYQPATGTLLTEVSTSSPCGLTTTLEPSLPCVNRSSTGFMPGAGSVSMKRFVPVPASISRYWGATR